MWTIDHSTTLTPSQCHAVHTHDMFAGVERVIVIKPLKMWVGNLFHHQPWSDLPVLPCQKIRLGAFHVFHIRFGAFVLFLGKMVKQVFTVSIKTVLVWFQWFQLLCHLKVAFWLKTNKILLPARIRQFCSRSGYLSLAAFTHCTPGWEPKIHTLDNGIRVAHYMGNLQQDCSLGTMLDVGSRDETLETKA